jgi:hypothetical protein
LTTKSAKSCKIIKEIANRSSVCRNLTRFLTKTTDGTENKPITSSISEQIKQRNNYRRLGKICSISIPNQNSLSSTNINTNHFRSNYSKTIQQYMQSSKELISNRLQSAGTKTNHHDHADFANDNNSNSFYNSEIGLQNNTPSLYTKACTNTNTETHNMTNYTTNSSASAWGGVVAAKSGTRDTCERRRDCEPAFFQNNNSHNAWNPSFSGEFSKEDRFILELLSPSTSKTNARIYSIKANPGDLPSSVKSLCKCPKQSNYERDNMQERLKNQMAEEYDRILRSNVDAHRDHRNTNELQNTLEGKMCSNNENSRNYEKNYRNQKFPSTQNRNTFHAKSHTIFS